MNERGIFWSPFCLLFLYQFSFPSTLLNFLFFTTATVDYVEQAADDILMVCGGQKVNRPPSTLSCTDKYSTKLCKMGNLV